MRAFVGAMLLSRCRKPGFYRYDFIDKAFLRQDFYSAPFR